MIQDGMGDTGTTRSNNDYSNMLLMNRAMNPSLDMRPPIISPFLNQENRRSIMHPTPLRHNLSFMSNISNSVVPNFGGNDRDP